MTIAEAYEKYKHMDAAFSNPRIKEYGFDAYSVVHDLWLAVKEDLGERLLEEEVLALRNERKLRMHDGLVRGYVAELAGDEAKRLRLFADAMLADFPDIEEPVFEAAVKYGLLVATKPIVPCIDADPEAHCNCLEGWDRADFAAGRVTCYRRPK